MNDLTFDKAAWDEYLYWQTQDKRTIKRINQLIKSIVRDGIMEGVGKPEPLKNRPGYSRRIDEANRLVYELDELKELEAEVMQMV